LNIIKKRIKFVTINGASIVFQRHWNKFKQLPFSNDFAEINFKKILQKTTIQL